MAHRGPHLGELLNRVADLLVEDAPVRDNDDGVEDRGIVPAQSDELVGEPGDGIRLDMPPIYWTSLSANLC